VKNCAGYNKYSKGRYFRGEKMFTPTIPTPTFGFKCRTPSGAIAYVTWKFFYPDCSNKNILCNAKAGGWLSAVTVCSQQLF